MGETRYGYRLFVYVNFANRYAFMDLLISQINKLTLYVWVMSIGGKNAEVLSYEVN